jgi:hypothetical protein
MLWYPDDGSEPPDLNEIPPAEWKDVLRPLLHGVRKRAVGRLRSETQLPQAAMVLVELEMEDHETKGSLRSPDVPRSGAVEVPARATRQVNLRLSGARYEELAGAAESLGLKPTQLARLFVERGLQLYRPMPGLGIGASPDQS